MRSFTIFGLALIGIFVIDQNIKTLFVEGYYYDSSCFSLELHYNKGVAFSLLAFMGEYLKWFQMVLVVILVGYAVHDGWVKKYPFALGILMGGALSNLYDRFIHTGVVDYVAWHCGFEYAVFNFADVVIDLTVFWLLLAYYLETRKKKKL